MRRMIETESPIDEASLAKLVPEVDMEFERKYHMNSTINMLGILVLVSEKAHRINLLKILPK
jgi:hypothetical protein